ncbi:hypothetical protein SCOR_30740 [Sulfidibacter corallicola]|uniref:Uncharacterized protein n=1 Tax=Sulfidibacter corallicola TaxID=2818388 RepID=A0A8A4TJG9_SULCO|nr:hypothetical protein [Sulfidibacter corallicola]QTD50066.1 hypothetical protein J3U87_31160 [Sulfidibacter corallicola]
MSHANPFESPKSNITSEVTDVDEIAAVRKALLPMWIVIFSWLFLIVGVGTALIWLFSAISGGQFSSSFFGFEASAPAFHPYSLGLLGLYTYAAALAGGLLLKLRWAPKAGILWCLVGSTMCIISTVLSQFTVFRLEILVLIAFLIKLKAIRPVWENGPQLDVDRDTYDALPGGETGPDANPTGNTSANPIP